MLFNTWFGQMRPKPKDLAWACVPGDYYYRPKRPIGKIYLQRIADKNGQEYQSTYEADSRGNMRVEAPEHIRDFVGLGYPIYCGLFMELIQRPDGPSRECPRHHFLLWPDNPAYNDRFLEGISKLKGVT
jgi:hypothetical protein